ncbi:hypothetical protein [Roseomonas sp. BN140053]|uniref:hypothetical protein n=1 Tax=Roseomonas sp. BN140053 TaxID=3391898 RepID=UPI0039EA8812
MPSLTIDDAVGDFMGEAGASPWTVLRDCPLPPEMPEPAARIRLVLLNPAVGLLLLDLAPDQVARAAARLRARLDAGGFGRAFQGHLPIVYRSLTGADLWRLTSVLDSDLQAQPPIGVRDGAWVEAARRILAAPLPEGTEVATAARPASADASAGPAAPEVDAAAAPAEAAGPTTPPRPAPGVDRPPPQARERSRVPLLLAVAVLAAGGVGAGIWAGYGRWPAAGPSGAAEHPAGYAAAVPGAGGLSQPPPPGATVGEQAGTAAGRTASVAPAATAPAVVPAAVPQPPWGGGPGVLPGLETAVPAEAPPQDPGETAVALAGAAGPAGMAAATRSPPVPPGEAAPEREVAAGSGEEAAAGMPGMAAGPEPARPIAEAAVPVLTPVPAGTPPEPLAATGEGERRAIPDSAPAGRDEPGPVELPEATPPLPAALPATGSAALAAVPPELPAPPPGAGEPAAAALPPGAASLPPEATGPEAERRLVAAAFPAPVPLPAAPLPPPEAPRPVVAPPLSGPPPPSVAASALPAAASPLPPVAGPPSPPPAPAPSPELVAVLLRRGDAMFAAGDISAARLFYERAAAAGSGAAATAMGRSFDPAFLAGIGARGIRPDPRAAATWYRRGAELGQAEAAGLARRLGIEDGQARR